MDLNRILDTPVKINSSRLSALHVPNSTVERQTTRPAGTILASTAISQDSETPTHDKILRHELPLKCQEPPRVFAFPHSVLPSLGDRIPQLLERTQLSLMSPKAQSSRSPHTSDSDSEQSHCRFEGVGNDLRYSPDVTRIPVENEFIEVAILKDLVTNKFVCGICKSKSFGRRSDLNRHVRIHLDLRENVCHICSKAFVQKSALTIHLRTHSGERPFHCETCGRGFSDSSSLSRHRYTHMNKEKGRCEQRRNRKANVVHQKTPSMQAVAVIPQLPPISPSIVASPPAVFPVPVPTTTSDTSPASSSSSFKQVSPPLSSQPFITSLPLPFPYPPFAMMPVSWTSTAPSDSSKPSGVRV